MSKPKSEVISLRLNPRNKEDARALQILHDNKAKGFTYRKSVTHAILTCAGDTPEMYGSGETELTAGDMEHIIETTVGGLLEDFASYIIDKVLEDVKNGHIVPDAENPFEGNEDAPDRTSYEERLAQSIAQRRKQKRG